MLDGLLKPVKQRRICVEPPCLVGPHSAQNTISPLSRASTKRANGRAVALPKANSACASLPSPLPPLSLVSSPQRTQEKARKKAADAAEKEAKRKEREAAKEKREAEKAEKERVKKEKEEEEEKKVKVRLLCFARWRFFCLPG